MKIVVTGSLGNIGKNLTRQLVKNGHEVIGIIRSPENASEIESIGAIPAIGSVDDAEFLTETFNGADAVFTMVPPNYSIANSREYYNLIGNAYAEAIKKAGVKKIVNISSWGAHLPEETGFITGAHDVEQILNKLPAVKITHIRSGYIYYNLFHFAGMIKNLGFIGSNYGGNDKIVLTSTRDIADVSFEELIDSSGVGINVRYIASDDRTASEIAETLGKEIGIPDLEWKTFTNEEVRKNMEKQGLSEDIIFNTIDLNTSIHNGKMREDYDAKKSTVTGKVGLEDFAKEFAAYYKNV
ncbi:Uncharacterized conserved protein YbjT, contains NAD(P)-binding and DUF2867 domains [Chryseobacterium oranimense]|uniref:Uncharacterized conserved protein YbjT, contains NAD(P)-binding and DUF2867 domains n=1 Tax=Chryseobacterium oranimense TaxID=421058 RepID=A0A1M5VBZ9_9FLAO|nr:NAD(P)H-binding protein [Chryseobacterium oranimense]SHH72721.1 Uncharacterized conserved protein YbjT, contains NAD(P)-binding and DUF2867 domains [Chryseobacterium oranimense]